MRGHGTRPASHGQWNGRRGLDARCSALKWVCLSQRWRRRLHGQCGVRGVTSRIVLEASFIGPGHSGLTLTHFQVSPDTFVLVGSCKRDTPCTAASQESVPPQNYWDVVQGVTSFYVKHASVLTVPTHLQGSLGRPFYSAPFNGYFTDS